MMNRQSQGQDGEFLRLMSKKNWRALALYTKTAEGQEEAKRLSSRRFGKYKWNILHALCWWGAPLTVLTQITSLFFLASEKDTLGQTPLHISIVQSHSIDVVTHLLNINPATVLAKDDKGRIPLVSLCIQLEADGIYNNRSRLEQYHGLIRSLIEKIPSSVVEEDNEGMSALEHAICGGAPRKFVQTLQKAAVDAGNSRCNQAYGTIYCTDSINTLVQLCEEDSVQTENKNKAAFTRKRRNSFVTPCATGPNAPKA